MYTLSELMHMYGRFAVQCGDANVQAFLEMCEDEDKNLHWGNTRKPTSYIPDRPDYEPHALAIYIAEDMHLEYSYAEFYRKKWKIPVFNYNEIKPKEITTVTNAELLQFLGG